MKARPKAETRAGKRAGKKAAGQEGLSRAEIYQKLFEFNLYIQQGIAALLSLERAKEVSAQEVRRTAECFEEFRADASGYLAGVISEREDREAGRLFVRRRRRDMAEDPKHGGWLEEEKKRQKELRKR